jgi:glutamate-1-semialdehyde aminotransferase
MLENDPLHGIVLLFDKVITGFGRIGGRTAAGKRGITPDIITMAKGQTDAAVPMDAVAASRMIQDTVVEGGPDGIERESPTAAPGKCSRTAARPCLQSQGRGAASCNELVAVSTCSIDKCVAF